jgi:hypothetical protein
MRSAKCFFLGADEFIAIKEEVFGNLDVMTVALLIYKSVRMRLIKRLGSRLLVNRANQSCRIEGVCSMSR